MCWTMTFPGMILNQHRGLLGLGSQNALGHPMTAQEGTDQNLRASNVYKQKGGSAEENKGEVHPRFWKAFHGSPASQVQDPRSG